VASTAEMRVPGTPADQVLAQSPPANASQVEAPRTSLLVTVAADPPAYVMPSFVGQLLGTASHTLEDAGFRLGNVSMAPPLVSAEALTPAPVVSPAPLQPSPASTIVVQTPPAGQKVLAGAVVNFEVRF
jgi:eukaryotic-like serine/threonine-protein kinase